MSVRRLAKRQPDKFSFNGENLEQTQRVVAKYPAGKTGECCHSLARPGSASGRLGVAAGY